jgi:hypothetical protein
MPRLLTAIFDITSAIVKLPLDEFPATMDNGNASKPAIRQ